MDSNGRTHAFSFVHYLYSSPMFIISGSKIITKRSVKHYRQDYLHQRHVHKPVLFRPSGVFEAFHFSIQMTPTPPFPSVSLATNVIGGKISAANASINKMFVWNRVQAAKTLLLGNFFNIVNLANTHPVYTPISQNMMTGGEGVYSVVSFFFCSFVGCHRDGPEQLA